MNDVSQQERSNSEEKDKSSMEQDVFESSDDEEFAFGNILTQNNATKGNKINQ